MMGETVFEWIPITDWIFLSISRKRKNMVQEPGQWVFIMPTVD